MKFSHALLILLVLSILCPAISFGSIAKINSPNQITNGTLIDFEGINDPYSSMPAFMFEHPEIQFHTGMSVNDGAGGSIFIQENNNSYINNSVLTALFIPIVYPDAPIGLSCQRFTFTDSIKSFGFNFQDGYALGGVLQGEPMHSVDNAYFEILIKAYDSSTNLIGELSYVFQHEPDGEGGYLSDLYYMGFSTDSDEIKMGEIIYNQGSKSGYAIDNFSFSTEPKVVPIPSSLGLLGFGLLWLAKHTRRKPDVKSPS